MKHGDLINHIRVIRTREEAHALNKELVDQKLLSVDSEWYQYVKDKGQPINNGLSFCWTFAYYDKNQQPVCIYMHNYRESDGNIHELRETFTKPVDKCAHNAPVDYHMAANHGIVSQAFDLDTMVLDFLLDENRENRHGLKECAFDFLGHSRVSFNETFGKAKLKNNGDPYASGLLVVPSINEFVEESAAPTIEEAMRKDDELSHKWLRLYEYAVADAYDGLLLYSHYKKKAEKIEWMAGKSLWDYYLAVERPITNLIQRMERRGMYIDTEFLAQMKELAEDDLQELQAKTLEWAGCPMNLGSTKEMSKLLYGVGRFPVMKGKKLLYEIPGRGLPILRTTEKGAPSTKAEHIVELRKKVGKMGYKDLDGLDHYLTWKKREKLRGTYLVGLSEATQKNRVHGRLNQIGTTSGRFSSSQPNLQNISSGEKDVYNIRDAFTCPPGHTLIVADFSQLEYRLLAHFSQDPALIKMFINGWDMHSLTTYNIFPNIKAEVHERFGTLSTEALKWLAEEYPNQRKHGKLLNFEIIYGVGPGKIADQLNISMDEAKRMVEGWFAGYPMIRPWMNRKLSEARNRGFSRTLAGRYRRPNLQRLMHDCQPGCRYRKKDDKGNERRCGIKGEEERTFVNAIIQGSAADMTKKAMLNLDGCAELHKLGFTQVMQVHDEIIAEIPRQNARRAIEIMRPLMEQPFSEPLRIPMPVSIGLGPTWSSAKV